MRFNLGSYLLTFLVGWALWLLLTWTFDPQELVAGAVVSALVALPTHARFTAKGLRWLHPMRLLCLVLYIPIFLWEMIKANLDVAYRVLHPKRPIRPGIVRTKTRLASNLGKVTVANSITLTPGTITLEVDGDDLYIHWIYVRETDPERVYEAIPGPFEKCLRRLFE